jgi:hypothetical protein
MHTARIATTHFRKLELALAFAAVAMLCLYCAARVAAREPETPLTPEATHAVVNAATRFEYVALFAPGTTGRAIENWRNQVLAQPHTQACAHGRACTLRMLRLSALGPQHLEALAFDLAAETPIAERAAILAAAAQVTPAAQIHTNAAPHQVAGNRPFQIAEYDS